MNYKTNGTQDVVIDVIQMIWKLLSQWKMILIAALFSALIVSGAKYFMEYRSYSDQLQDSAQETKEISKEELVEEALAALSAKDRKTVMYLTDLQKLVLTQQKYLNESVLLNANYTNQRSLELIYYIEGEAGEDIQSLCDSYKQCMRMENLYYRLASAIKPDADVKYIPELIATESSDLPDSNAKGTTLRIRMVLTEESDTSMIERIITSTFDEESVRLKAVFGEHSVRLLNMTEKRKYASEVIDKRAAITNSINAAQNNIKNYYALLTDEQKGVMELITEMQLLDDNSSDLLEITDESGVAEAVNRTEEAGPDTPHFKPVFAIIGFILGIMAYVFFYVVSAIMRGRIISPCNAEFYTGSRLLGDIQGDRKHYSGLAMLTHSRLVDKIRYRGRGDADSELDKIAEKLKAVCEHAGVSALSIVSISDLQSEACRKTESILQAVRAKGIDAEMLSFGKDVNESDLLRIQNVVSVVGDDSNSGSILQMMQLFKEYDIRKLGCIFVEE